MNAETPYTLCAEMLATLRANLLRGTITTQDDAQFERLLDKYQSTAIIANAHRILKRKYKGLPLWVLVRDLWGVGSARAADIAREAGYDPHQVCGKLYLRKP